MSQQEVLDVLKKEPRLTAEEISKIVDTNSTAVRKCLNRLLKHQEIKRIGLTKKQIEKLNKSFSGVHYVWETIEE